MSKPILNKLSELEKREYELRLQQLEEENKRVKKALKNAKDAEPIKRASRQRVEREAKSKGFGVKK